MDKNHITDYDASTEAYIGFLPIEEKSEEENTNDSSNQ